jgi:sugar phosphate isomerase/epimerase
MPRKGVGGLFVSAAAECFPDFAKDEILPMLVDLEFTSVELPLHEEGFTWIKPSDVLADFERAGEICRDTNRLSISAFSVDPGPWVKPQYYDRFTACCKLAKALRVVPLVVPSSELGTPFNEEIERLRELVKIASLEGCLVALKTTIGCMTEDPDTAVVLCDNVKGLGLALDPSHYIAGPRQGRDFSKVMPYVFHVHLRDSSKSQVHVRVGQGEVDYGRLITQLQNVGYDRALSVHMGPLPGQDHRAEMRKMRLLLDSLL